MKTYPELLRSLENDCLCLTATNRLARQIMSFYDQFMCDAGCQAWSRPTILSLESWVQVRFNSLNSDLRLLSHSQALFLWEEIIRKDVAEQGHELLQVPPTARKARQAYRLLMDYRTSFAKHHAAEDQRAFLRWQEQWEEQLCKNGWLDPAAITGHLAAAVEAGQVELPAAIVFAGFDDFNPAQKYLQESLATAGCDIRIFSDITTSPASQVVYQAPDMQSEVEQCARWLRQELTVHPESNIGVVAPQLEFYRDTIVSKFQAELDPSGKLSGNSQFLPFNISLGRELLSEGVISAAMRILTLPPRVSAEDISWLLRTPFIRNAMANQALRGRADLKFRKKGIFELPFWKLAGALRDTGCDESFLAIIEKLKPSPGTRGREYPGTWAERFAGLLQACGWPGDRTLTSREYQAVDKFREILSELASHDPVSPLLDRSAVSRILQRLCRETTFQPESHGAQVQILGMLEAGGLKFDALWVLGMHSGAIPQPINPNPFIPLSLQRREQMPHADATRELEYSRRLVDRLAASAGKVIFSWPSMDGDLNNRPAKQLESLPEAEMQATSTSAPAQVIFAAQPGLEKMSDCRVAPVVSKKPVKGGTGIVKDQALCPFRAFAHHRLDARGLESPDIGLDNMTRGTLVHSMLEFFWAETGDHEQLSALSRHKTIERLESAALKAVAREESSKKSDLPTEIRKLEVQRLIGQGVKWLEIERQRTFFEVAEQEQLYEETIGRLHFRTRIDRIDRLEDGTLAIIDYKTGVPDPMQWFGHRISEPQLPIYCQKLKNEEIGAVLFAAVRNKPSECRFSGIARHPEMFPRLNERKLQSLLEEKGWKSIDQVLDSWRNALPELGNAFASGEASVDPVDQDETCRYCDLVAFCRIFEADSWAAWEAENG